MNLVSKNSYVKYALYFFGIFIALVSTYKDVFDPNHFYNRPNSVNFGFYFQDFTFLLFIWITPSVLPVFLIKNRWFYAIWLLVFIWNLMWLYNYYHD